MCIRDRLRVIQEQEFERVGGGAPIRVNVRLVATTNRDLREAVRLGEFREDLFYRLAVVPVTVPPLRDRLDDIPVLAQHFARKSGAAVGKDIKGLSVAALDYLQSHEWPGNVRELAHAIERAVILSTGPILDKNAFDLAPVGEHRTPRAATAPEHGIVTLHSFDVREAEAALIARALQETDDNRTRAAELLGISVRTLRNKLNTPD